MTFHTESGILPAETKCLMSDFKFACPFCQQHLQSDERLSGRQIQCPKCHHLIRVPPVPGQTAQFDPQSGMTWATFVPSGNTPPPQGVVIKPQDKPPKPPTE